MTEIKQGDIVRVTALANRFQGQATRVLAVHTRKHQANYKTTYRLATTWDTKDFPTWWDGDEIELVRKGTV